MWTREAAASRRALFDLDQGELRSAFWDFSASAEAVKCTRGDLIAINHEAIDEAHASARVTDVEVDDGKIVAVYLDAAVPVYNELDLKAVTDLRAIDDMLLVGAVTAIQIRRYDSRATDPLRIAGATGSRGRLELQTPVVLDLDDAGLPLVGEDNLALVGPSSSVAIRAIVHSVEYDENLNAFVTAVDEAPELWST